MGWLPYILHIMINLKEGFNKLLKDIQESSPNFKKTLKEISPISFCISLKGHKKIFISIYDNNSDISFEANNTQFEINGSLLEILYTIISGKINTNLIKGDAELAIVFFNMLYKSISRIKDTCFFYINVKANHLKSFFRKTDGKG